MEKHDAGIISFYEIADIINKNIYCYGDNELIEMKFIKDLSKYFKTLQNTGFDEEEFKILCLK